MLKGEKDSGEIKASLLMAISESDIKRGSLLNALAGIARQKVSVPFEICIVDDYSGFPDIDVFLRKYFEKHPVENLKRIEVKILKEKAGFISAPGQALNLTSESSDKIYILGSDCILLNRSAIDHLCKWVRPGVVAYSEVAEVKISSDFYENFENNSINILKEWDRHLLTRPTMVNRHLGVYNWLFFSGAATKEDLLKIGYNDLSCDAVLWQKMMPMGFQADLLTYIPTAHQAHARTAYPCVREDFCEYHCCRTEEKRGIGCPSWRKKMNVYTM
jgi:hypothetical protein